jgi:hypothetical protein
MSEPIPVEKQLPESGAVVLAWFEEKRKHKYSAKGWIRAMWVAKHTLEENYFGTNDELDCDYDETTDAYYIPEGWYELMDHWGEYAFVGISDLYQITHWLPLPDPPPTSNSTTASL